MGRKKQKTWEEMTELERLKEENERLRTEVAYLKKLRELRLRDEALTRERQKQLEKWSMEDFDQIAKLVRATYYYQMKQGAKEDPDKVLKAEIQAIYEEHKGNYGYRRIHLELRIRRKSRYASYKGGDR